MLTLKATTRNHEIERASRDELRDAMLNFSGETKSEINKMNKGERVTRCRLIRDDLEKQAIRREAHLETQRLEKLATERKNPVYSAAINAIHTGVTKVYDAQVETVKEWQEKVTKSDPLSVVWNMENGIEDVFRATAYAEHLQHCVGYLKHQHEKRTDTVGDIKGYLQDHADELLRRCLNDEEYNHNSTSEVDSVKSREKFRALQTAARLMKQAVKAFTKDINADHANAAINGGHLYDSRGF